jgi:hypothetical protein
MQVTYGNWVRLYYWFDEKNYLFIEVEGNVGGRVLSFTKMISAW